eukprot:CAMPEP_0118694808 /NCGR_PEP_ID=MMETSP0800-20121206/12775_1 /TAXON_ID=210618 ORGANISM="Striatella unipunctata, Strain CCMP2910" /NCGR_SAMPLE_ID=MMETSP0800 /ASSEMBLY_ACC=CAM_ASM_000638 /LENGTH=178 /DNA_ID=CAMNT_0006593407 /DNA_START=194 /DNA_END=730 /DNA_ORIENTATION=-
MNDTNRRSFHTADICDVHFESPSRLSIVQPGLLRHFGGETTFSGKMTTIQCLESNPLVRTTLSSQVGDGDYDSRVLVVDGGASMRVALLGDQIAKIAVENKWKGIIIHGCIRDSHIIKTLPLGVMAIATYPLKSAKTHPGRLNVPVVFGGVEFVPGHYVYADEDGIVTSEHPLELPQE